MLTIGGILVLLLGFQIDSDGIVHANVAFDSPGKGYVVTTYHVAGCLDDLKLVNREDMTTRWVYDGPRVADQIASRICDAAAPRGRM